MASPTLTVLRAVGAEFARRIYKPILIIVLIIAVIAVGLMIVLIMQSAWWLLLAVPVFFAVLIAATVLAIAGFIIYTVNPTQNSSQKKAVRRFVDKLQNLSEVTQTPKFILLFQVVRDMVGRREDGFVKTTIGHTLTLKKEFDELRRLFES